jgi:hypothetical protein
MHPDNRGVDHLHRGIMGGGQRVHDAAPNASPSPANEAVVAGGVRTEVIGQVAPWCSGSQHPEDAIEDAPVIHPWHAARLVRQHRLDGCPFVVGKFVAHDSSPRFRGLNHDPRAGLNEPSIRHHLCRFWSKPDINRLTRPAGSVENDPLQTSRPNRGHSKNVIRPAECSTGAHRFSA